MVFTAAVAMILSSLYVRFRDVAPIWSVLSTVLFYGTPVIYAIDVVPAGLASTRSWPTRSRCCCEQTRHWVVDPTTPPAISAIGGWPWALIPLAVFVGVCALGLWVFNHEAPRIAERL